MVSWGTNTNLKKINIKIDNNMLSKDNHIIFLSVTTDEILTWKTHLLSICTRISQITGVLYRIRNCLPLDCIIMVYLSTVYSQAIWVEPLKYH